MKCPQPRRRALLIVDMQKGLFHCPKKTSHLGTRLADSLREAAVDELVIVGMKTEYCIDATCRAAADLGFQPLLVADAHTCMDTPVLSAQSIIDHHNRTLNGPFVRLVNTEECEF